MSSGAQRCWLRRSRTFCCCCFELIFLFFFFFLILCVLRPLDGNECFRGDSGNVTDVVCPLFCFHPLEEGDLSCWRRFSIMGSMFFWKSFPLKHVSLKGTVTKGRSGEAVCRARRSGSAARGWEACARVCVCVCAWVATNACVCVCVIVYVF